MTTAIHRATSTMADLHWGTASKDEMPEGAMPEEISCNGRDVYITKIELENGEVQPAEVVDATAHVTLEGKELLIPLESKYSVLLKSRNMRWVRVQDRQLPEGCVPVGHTPDGTPLYVTRVRYPYVTDIAIGKVKQGEDTTYPFMGRERRAPDFDVLTSH